MIYIAVIGPGESATAGNIADAHAVRALCALRGWTVLTGGREAGVMAAAAEGALSAGGLSVGLLPGSDRSGAASALTVSLPTGLGEARNMALITAANGVVACGMSPGTLSEIALAVAADRPLALVRPDETGVALLTSLGSAAFFAGSAEEAVQWMHMHLDGRPAG